jgi:release factor glutamine methyltransferase
VTLGNWIRQAEPLLAGAGIDSARLEAQMLVGALLNKDRAYVLTHPEAEVDESALKPLLERRIAREPLPYILGIREFYTRSFKVTPAVLIPRQETETLIECVFDYLPDEPLTVIDVGTGSGCIGLTLALEAPNWQVTCCDISPEALAVAQANVKSLKAKASLIHSDLFSQAPGPWDLIISNPPYISMGEVTQPEVRDWEPDLALYAQQGGMAIYQRLLIEAPAHLSEGGLMMLEVGDGRSEELVRCAKAAKWAVLELREDLSGLPRALVLARA